VTLLCTPEEETHRMPLSNFPATMTSFDASLGYNGSSRRNSSRNGNYRVFLRNFSEEYASHF
jgi:hypothetical protein